MHRQTLYSGLVWSWWNDKPHTYFCITSISPELRITSINLGDGTTVHLSLASMGGAQIRYEVIITHENKRYSLT